MTDRVSKIVRIVLSLPRYAKRISALTVDTGLCVITVWLAFYLHLGEFAILSGPVFWAVAISVAVALPTFAQFGLYRTIFRYSGFTAAFVWAFVVYAVIYVSVITAIQIPGMPHTVGLIQSLLLFVAISGTRSLVRHWLGGMRQSKLQKASLPRTLIYGAGSAGCQLVSALENGSKMLVAGFLDDDYRLHGQILNGQRIFSPDELKELIESKGITHVLLAMPSASRRRRNEILKKLSSFHVAVRTVPSATDLAAGRVTTSELLDLDIDDLLGREAVAPNYILLVKNIGARVVLVTGAGGSIGSELCRQIIKLKPEKLLLVDISEFALYSIQSELEDLREASGDSDAIPIVPLLASVQDEERMREIFDTWLPQTVYHAAAYKHVPLVEHNLAEGIKNNVFGTLTTAQVAIEKGVSDFVLVSTDKAVRPTNVMGASKRLAELCLQALFALQVQQVVEKGNEKTSQGIQPTQSSKTKLSIVRFGNVLDSSGSVIPKFRKQISDGGPITLTHPEIMRYFMTIPEAAQLVIQASAMATGGDVFVLDMGKSVKIVDLVRRMVTLSGFSIRDEARSDGDIEIVVTGLRPGEKLYEELMLGDNPQPTIHPKIRCAHDPFIPWHELLVGLETLKIQLSHNKVEMILAILQKLVAGYQSSGEVVDWVFMERIRQSNCVNEPKTLLSGSSRSRS